MPPPRFTPQRRQKFGEGSPYIQRDKLAELIRERGPLGQREAAELTGHGAGSVGRHLNALAADPSSPIQRHKRRGRLSDGGSFYLYEYRTDTPSTGDARN